MNCGRLIYSALGERRLRCRKHQSGISKALQLSGFCNPRCCVRAIAVDVPCVKDESKPKDSFKEFHRLYCRNCISLFRKSAPVIVLEVVQYLWIMLAVPVTVASWKLNSCFAVLPSRCKQRAFRGQAQPVPARTTRISCLQSQRVQSCININCKSLPVPS